MDYNEFAEKIKVKYPQYKDIDNQELANKMIAKYPEYKEQVTFEIANEKSGIDLTPSGISKTIAAGIVSPIEAIRTKKPLPEAFSNVRNEFQTNPVYKHPVRDVAMDTTAMLYLPVAKAFQGSNALARFGNYGLTGAYQGGLIGGAEALKQNANIGNVAKGSATGAITGGLIGGGLPVAGNMAEKAIKFLPMAGGFASRTLGRIKPETLAQAVKPNSKALDLTEAQAQNLLMNTTERVQNTYDDLLRQRGQKVGDVAKGLNNTGIRLNAEDLVDDITETFNKYQGDVVNPARNMTGTLENDLVDLVIKSADEADTVSPVDLNKLKQQVGHMTNWSDAVANNYQNPILEQVYGKWGNRLNELSPELAQANARYAQLRNFQKNEGLKRILKPGDTVDTASSALRNYNNTVTKGNTSRNIQDLENLFVKEGKQSFLNDIDDVNAAMDLLNARGTGDSWLANLATQATRPALKTVRAINRSNLPEIYKRLGKKIPKTLVPVLYGTPTLYGGVEYNEY